MSVTIDINNAERVIRTEPGASLLSVLSAHGIFIPSSCGGRAICGMCKVKVLSGAGEFTTGELRLLSESERTGALRLSCQVRADRDLKLTIPEELFVAKKFKTRVVSKKALTADVTELRLRLAPSDRLMFRAGQFAQLVIPPHDQIGTETVRAYSIATPPSSPGELEFNVRAIPKGIASAYIGGRLKEGDELSLIGPMGEFVLREGDADMICIAGSTGMAPIKSILLDMFERKIPKRSIWYFFGALAKADLFYLDLFRNLEKSWPIFHFVPALSTPAPGDNWPGETGLIPDVAGRFLDSAIDKNTPKEAYLCGSPGFINASIKMLTGRRVPRERVYFDKFV